MCNDSGDPWIPFNGEIYDNVEIREERQPRACPSDRKRPFLAERLSPFSGKSFFPSCLLLHTLWTSVYIFRLDRS